jgi:hypothetical protein
MRNEGDTRPIRQPLSVKPGLEMALLASTTAYGAHRKNVSSPIYFR